MDDMIAVVAGLALGLVPCVLAAIFLRTFFYILPKSHYKVEEDEEE